MPATVLLAGGGTGGHVLPSLATAGALREARPDLAVEFVGTPRGLESRLVPAAGWTLHHVEVLPFVRSLSLSTARVPLALLRAVRTVGAVIRQRNVVGAIVFGGYVSLPLALAARRVGVPFVVHEQNAVPGLANKLAARGASSVAATFPESAARFPDPDRVVVTGNPVRPGLSGVDRAALRAQARETFGLKDGRATLLVFGGSLGARSVNRAVIETTSHWAQPERLQVLHAAGRKDYADSEAAWRQMLRRTGSPLHVRCVDFIERMDLAYAAADVAVTRAGASTIAELTVLGLPSVLVPYPHATADHQTANARSLAEAGVAEVVVDADLTGTRLVSLAEPLLLDEQRHAALQRGLRKFARPDAAARVAELLLGQLAGATAGRAGNGDRS